MENTPIHMVVVQLDLGQKVDSSSQQPATIVALVVLESQCHLLNSCIHCVVKCWGNPDITPVDCTSSTLLHIH
jgi:hypothetical protein